MWFRGQFSNGYAKSRWILVVGWCFAFGLTAGVLGQERVDIQFGFQENDWSDPTSLDFVTTPIVAAGGSWGNEDMTDFYVETGNAADQIDALIPGVQGVTDSGLVIATFETRYLANNQSFLAFGSDIDPENAVFFGHGEGKFHIGTGTEFNLSGATPSGVSVANSFTVEDAVSGEATIADDSRIGVRVGFDVSANVLRNFQVDANNDGQFDLEFIDVAGGNTIATPDVSPLDWFLVTYAGRAGSRADNVSIVQQSSVGDYNQDLDFNQLDANIICRNGIVEGDLTYDYDGNGTVEIRDVNDFAFDHGSLPADMDFDGGVNFADFLVLSGNFGQAGSYSDGDITCNGRVDFADFLALSTFFGNEARAQPVNFTQSHAVPEPDSSYYCYVALAFIGFARRRK